MADLRVGLVLSGGGAKGAYQVGVLKALLQSGARVDAISGASIGALNGAVLASAPSLPTGVERLQELWETLASEPPLTPNFPAYLHFFLSAGLALHGFGHLKKFIGIASLAGFSCPNVSQGLLSDEPLHDLINSYLDPVGLQQGIPLYVSVFKSRGLPQDMFGILAAESGLSNTPKSEFLHLQSLPMAEQRDALLASAALPMLFELKKINDSTYIDGGIGGWATNQGNTPITPLLQAGIDTIIVTHLSDGALWSRQDFPSATILEIRPQSTLARSGRTPDLLGFDKERIPSWIAQGYEDACVCLERVMDALKSHAELRNSCSAITESEKRIAEQDPQWHAAMNRLHNKNS